jgi:hypothetical protein
VDILRLAGPFGDTTPSMAKQTSRHFHVPSFGRSDETFCRVRKSSVLTLARHGESKV